MPTLELDGAQVFYGDGGVAWRDDRPLAVFVHGAGNDHSVWAMQARTVAQHGASVAAVDLPGHGRTQDRTDLESVEAYARWLQDVIAALRAPQAPLLLVGHSMGACIALTVAASWAEPDSLRLALIGAGETMPVSDQLLEATLHRPIEAHRFITAYGFAHASHFGGAEAPGVWNLGAALALLERCPPAVLHRDFAACNAWHGAELAERVRSPTLVIAGAHDRMTPPRGGRALSERISGARFELIADAGHMMMAEAPSRLNELILEASTAG